MTSGERMVFAAEYVRVLSERGTVASQAVRDAIDSAAHRVLALRRWRDGASHDPDITAMVDDMLGTGADRAPLAMPIPGGGG